MTLGAAKVLMTIHLEVGPQAEVLAELADPLHLSIGDVEETEHAGANGSNAVFLQVPRAPNGHGDDSHGDRGAVCVDIGQDLPKHVRICQNDPEVHKPSVSKNGPKLTKLEWRLGVTVRITRVEHTQVFEGELH